MKSTATIVFKSGATIEVDVSEISSARNRVSGELTKIEWTSHEDAQRRLLTINLESVDAIVFNEGDEADSASDDAGAVASGA